MKTMKAIIMIALTLSLTIALTTYNTNPEQIQEPEQTHVHENEKPLGIPTTLPLKRVSRFLAEEKERGRNPRAADHCHKEGQKCSASNTYCCNNKCVDLHYDDKNCGACKKKCKYTQSCCRGKCVNLSYDKRNCGYCGTKCKEYCIYGICDYA